ncbi:Protein LCHN [Purpureocillium lavendulum]|uniref:Protein LCHN n=1 Tax=Purpureocillium lavendulum TaxID=1247861 RepID=A0AB34G4Z7_9HYPO|nr:Protein LCHN [Purpureocillium lavendulum]
MGIFSSLDGLGDDQYAIRDVISPDVSGGITMVSSPGVFLSSPASPRVGLTPTPTLADGQNPALQASTEGATFDAHLNITAGGDDADFQVQNLDLLGGPFEADGYQSDALGNGGFLQDVDTCLESGAPFYNDKDLAAIVIEQALHEDAVVKDEKGVGVNDVFRIPDVPRAIGAEPSTLGIRDSQHSLTPWGNNMNQTRESKPDPEFSLRAFGLASSDNFWAGSSLGDVALPVLPASGSFNLNNGDVGLPPDSVPDWPDALNGVGFQLPSEPLQHTWNNGQAGELMLCAVGNNAVHPSYWHAVQCQPPVQQPIYHVGTQQQGVQFSTGLFTPLASSSDVFPALSHAQVPGFSPPHPHALIHRHHQPPYQSPRPGQANMAPALTGGYAARRHFPPVNPGLGDKIHASHSHASVKASHAFGVDGNRQQPHQRNPIYPSSGSILAKPQTRKSRVLALAKQQSKPNSQPQPTPNHYPVAGFRSFPSYPFFVPYGAPNVDRDGNPSPTYPPVNVIKSLIPPYGSPTAVEDQSAQLVGAPFIDEPLVYDDLTTSTQSPSCILGLEESSGDNKTKVAQDAQTNGAQSDVPVDPQIEICPPQQGGFERLQTTQAAATPCIAVQTPQNSQLSASQVIPASAGQGTKGQWPQPHHTLIQPRTATPYLQTSGTGATLGFQNTTVFAQGGAYCPTGGYIPAPHQPDSKPGHSFGLSDVDQDIKVDNSRNAKKNKNARTDPLQVYKTHIQPPSSFGPTAADGQPLFTYTSQCQLTTGRAFTTEELRQYVKAARCCMWLQQAPSQCADRMDDDDKKCRWASCPLNARTISSGWLRVAFDEFPGLTSNGTKDPFKMAGVLHLWCFEQVFDPMEFHSSGRLLPETRHLPKEMTNVMAINRDSDRDIVADCYEKWFKEHEAEFEVCGPLSRPREHRQSLSYALVRYHLDKQTTARHRARANRNQNKETGQQRTIDVHVGDLGLFARVSKSCRTAAKTSQSQQPQEVIVVDDECDTSMDDAMSIGWSPVADETSFITEPDRSPASGLQMFPAKRRLAHALGAEMMNSTPSKTDTTRSVLGVAIGAQAMTEQGKKVAQLNIDTHGSIADETKEEAPLFDLLNPGSWRDTTPAPPSPIHEYFNPLGSPLAGIAAPAVMQSPLKRPVVRGSMVARGLTAQQAILARAQEVQRRKSVDAVDTRLQGHSNPIGMKRKRDGECENDEERPFKVQHIQPLSPKRKRNEDDAAEIAPSPKRRRAETEPPTPTVTTTQQEDISLADPVQALAFLAENSAQQTTEAIPAANSGEFEDFLAGGLPDLLSGIPEPETNQEEKLDNLFAEFLEDFGQDTFYGQVQSDDPGQDSNNIAGASRSTST